jgi:hypothetical protein
MQNGWQWTDILPDVPGTGAVCTIEESCSDYGGGRVGYVAKGEGY